MLPEAFRLPETLDFSVDSDDAESIIHLNVSKNTGFAGGTQITRSRLIHAVSSSAAVLCCQTGELFAAGTADFLSTVPLLSMMVRMELAEALGDANVPGIDIAGTFGLFGMAEDAAEVEYAGRRQSAYGGRLPADREWLLARWKEVEQPMSGVRIMARVLSLFSFTALFSSFSPLYVWNYADSGKKSLMAR